MNVLYINYPSWIHPEIFPGVPFLGLLRWYGMMYLFAFGFAYIALKKQFKEGALNSPDKSTSEDDLISFIATGIIFLLLGARIFSTLIYDTSGKYLQKPWLIFWPFDASGRWTGLQGMSYHGGAIGGTFGMWVWCKMRKRPYLKWTDAMCTAIPLGYTFGRIGNFLNGELYGRITKMPWGMVFPDAERFSSSIEWVKNFAADIGMEILPNTLVNLPRHPSQLYESFFEGIVLFAILWFLRKKKPFDGFLSGLYLAGYGVFRFALEYFRMPDSDLGFRISSDPAASISQNTSLLNISTGQILCFLMILAGSGIIIGAGIASKLKKQKA
ncbi:MAG: prolipoprotein diacylglyceryl transferase [Treponema sp.]|nr:prolipoprotein diacylglyceryl transferase [Treponema sp.]